MNTLTGIAMAAGACGVVRAVLIGVAFASHRRQRRTRLASLVRLRQERSVVTREDVVAWLVKRGVRHSVVTAVYDVVRQRRELPEFPRAHDDPLERVRDIVVHEEIDDILTRAGLPRAGEQRVRGVGVVSTA